MGRVRFWGRDIPQNCAFQLQAYLFLCNVLEITGHNILKRVCQRCPNGQLFPVNFHSADPPGPVLEGGFAPPRTSLCPLSGPRGMVGL